MRSIIFKRINVTVNMSYGGWLDAVVRITQWLQPKGYSELGNVTYIGGHITTYTLTLGGKAICIEK